MRFSAADILTQFEPAYVARGKQYWQQHRVEGFSIAGPDDGATITATVQGTEARPYHVQITPQQRRDGFRFSNRCSCAMEGHCKHVVAVLFEACNQFQREDLRKSPAKVAPSVPGLTEEVSEWLEAFEAERPELAARRAGPSKQLLYVLGPDRRQKPRLTLATVRLDREGVIQAGEQEPYYAVDAALRSQPKFITHEDMDLLRALHPYRLGQGPAEYELRGDGSGLLRRMLDTGRLCWKDAATPLRREESRPARIEWQASEDGSQQLVFVADPPATTVLATAPPWYIDAERGVLGEITTSLDARSAALIVDAPRVTPQSLDVVVERLNRIAPVDVIPAPRSRRMRVEKDVAPHPVLFLFGRDRKSTYFNAPRTPLAALRLRFDYQGARVNPTDPETYVVRSHDDEIVQIERQLKVERELIKTLLKLIPIAPAQDELQNWEREGIEPDDYVMTGANTEVEWSHFVLQHAPQLQAQDWKIEYELSFPHRFAEVESWFGEVEPDARNEWFDLELGIQVEGQKVNLLPLLVQALRAGAEEVSVDRLRGAKPGQTLTLRLPDGRCVSLPYARISHLLGTLIELYEGQPLDEEGKLRLSRLDALRLAELQKAGQAASLRWFGDETLVALGEKLRDFSGITAVPKPQGLNATLRDYQLQGLSWLQFLREYQFGGILADDMGLGKTLQALAHILTEKEQGRLHHPALVVAPTSLVGNWAREAQRFAPSLRVLALHGQARRQQFSEIQDHDLIVTTYPLLPRDKSTLLKQHFHLLVLDEAQNIKNAKSLAAQMVQQINATHRLCLTGTPMENHLGELWSQFHFLQPGLLGDAAQFKRLYRTPIEKNADDLRRAHLIQRVTPFILRRTKQQVVKELPPKTEIVRSVALDGAQRDLYETVRLALNEKIRNEIEQRGMDRSHIVILDALLKLRQICCDPRLLKMDAARRADGSSAKLELLMDLLPEMMAEGRRVLLFSQFTSMLELIEQELNGQGIRYLKLTGETQHRQHLVDAFQRGDAPLFLISLKAGGVGLNLTAADTVIHYDPWWNPAVENQATDRAYRIGQDKPVFVYKLVAEGSIEEKIQALQARKAALAASILSGGEGEFGPQFSAEDLKSLFDPLD